MPIRDIGIAGSSFNLYYAKMPAPSLMFNVGELVLEPEVSVLYIG